MKDGDNSTEIETRNLLFLYSEKVQSLHFLGKNKFKKQAGKNIKWNENLLKRTRLGASDMCHGNTPPSGQFQPHQTLTLSTSKYDVDTTVT